MNRRDILLRIAAIAGAATWSGDTLAVQLARGAADREVTPSTAAAAPLTADQLAALSALADVIIPPTRTVGATGAAVPAFVADMYVHWMNDSERERFRIGLSGLDAQAQTRHRRPFSRCSAKQKAAIYAATRDDIKSYKPSTHGLAARIADPAAPFFYKARDLVTLGYFTSEKGVTEELAYVPVPGRFEGDVDVKVWNRQMQL